MTSGYKLSATSSRSLKFHDESTDPTVQQRYCAVWNPDLNGVGAWDTTGVNSIYSDDTITTCFATTLGTFAVVAQMDEKPYVQVKIDHSGVNFTNPLVKSANEPVHSILCKRCHSASPKELHPTLLVHRTRSYAQLLCCMHTLRHAPGKSMGAHKLLLKLTLGLVMIVAWLMKKRWWV